MTKLLPIWFTLFKTSMYVIHYKLLLLAHRLIFWTQEHIEAFKSSEEAVSKQPLSSNDSEQLEDDYLHTSTPTCATPKTEKKQYGQKKSAQVHYPHSMTP